jgi:IBR domain, a half RING-finger domain
MRKVEGGDGVRSGIGLVLDDSENAERASDVLDSLLREEEAAIRRELDSSRLPYCVCLVDQPGSMFHIMQACRHFYACKNCVKSFWEARIGDGQVSEKGLVCPVVDCSKAASITEVKALVSNSAFEKFERFQLERAIGCMDDTVLCRRKTCNMPAAQDSDNLRLARCAYCGYNFCCECGMTWHGNDLCSDLLSQYVKAESPSERVCQRLSCLTLELPTNVPCD